MIGQKLLLNHMEKGDLHIQKNLVEFQDLKRHIQDLDILFSDDGLSARYIKGKGQSKWYGQIKTNMAVKIKSWNKTKKKMVVEHHVAKYKK